MRRTRAAVAALLCIALVAMVSPMSLAWAGTRTATCAAGRSMLAEATPTASFPASPTVRFTPRKINARAHGRWIQARLVLPQGMSAADIDTSTVTISDVNGVPATLTATRMHVSLETTDAPSSLCMKFGRRSFVALLDKGKNVVTLSWATADGTPYSASATVCVTGKKHHRGGGHRGSGAQTARGRGHGRH